MELLPSDRALLLILLTVLLGCWLWLDAEYAALIAWLKDRPAYRADFLQWRKWRDDRRCPQHGPWMPGRDRCPRCGWPKT